ncbi:MAG: hypothetical protein K6D95_09070 [Treponema sp.]|nr:hypothetical protein [Treponema sp.]
MKNLFKSLFSLFCLSASLFIFSTCTIGLGKAVDIQAPTVNITYPPLSSIVSKEFTLGGTWSDDGSLKKIQVDIYKLIDGNKSSTPDFSSSSVQIKDNKWYLSVNKNDEDLYAATNGWQLSDGSYEIHVIAYDNGGHESQDVVHTLSIDNSAPVLMITNPTTTGDDEEKEEFGQIIQFVGSFYDLCGKIKKMDISFYDAEGNHIWDTDFTNIISLSDSSPLVVARYYANEEDQQKNKKIYQNYLHLFGEDNLTDYENDEAVDDALIYFTITAYDSAKSYSEENFLADITDGSDIEGNNKTTYFYRGTTSLQNLLAGETISDFNITEFAAFLNGTETFTESDTISQIAIESLSSSRDIENEDTAETITSEYLTFKFNPKNNPVYSVGGYDILSEIEDEDIDSYTKEEKNNNYYKNTYKNSSIPLSINVGNDNKAISTHTVSIYRVDKNVYSGTISDDMFTGDTGKTNYQDGCYEPLWTWNQDVYEEFNSWGVDISSVYTPTDTNKNIASISKSFTLSEFEAGHNYVIYVTGKDIAGNAIISGNTTGYGYCGTVSTQAASISQTGGKTNNAIINKACFLGTDESNEFYVKGTITSETQVQSLTYTITVTNAEDSSESQSENGTIDILTEDPSPLPDSYCYTNSGSAIPLVYNFRFSGKTIAETFKDFVGTGTYDVNLTLTANNGVSVNWSRDFTLDTQDPVPELSELTLAAEDTDDDDKGFWWVNPKKALTITGLVTDNKATAKTCVSWIKLVALSDESTEVTTTASGDVYTSTEQTDVNKWTFTVPASTIKSTYYGAKLYIYSKDTAGNTGCITETLAFDTTAPKGLHALDGNYKDLYFRIGSYNNDDISSDNALWDNNLDTDVGGKYQENTYGNSTTIKIRGNFEEEESGLNMIYYKVVPSTIALEYDDLKIQAEEFYENYNNAAEYTGYFAPLSSAETKRVFYTALAGRTDGNIPLKYLDEEGNIKTSSTEYIVSSTDKVDSKYYINIDSNFDSVISGFSATGTNYLILVAEDKVGNAALDSVIAKDSEGSDTVYYNASINVDQESPLLACSSHNGQEFTNGVSEISVSGTFEDLPDTSCAGVKDVSLTVNGESIPATLTPDSTNDYSSGSWSATIDAETVAAFTQGKTYNVNATVTDYAGNSSASTIFTLKFDTEAPVVSITTPSTSASLNGKMSLTGSVTYEDSAPVKLELYASKTAPADGDLLTNTSKYTKIGTITDASKIYSWSFANINTYTLTSVASAPTTADLYFIPVVTDTAGNTNTYNLTSKKNEFEVNTNYFKYTVDMDTDRPVVKVTNLSIIDGAYILKNGENAKIEGSISDDDSTSEKVVKTFIATTSQITSTTNVTSTTDTDSGIVTSKLRVGTSTPAVYDITIFNPATGEWTFTPADTSDGSKTVNFYIVDNEDTVFYTGKKNTVSTTDYYYESPYFKFISSAKESNIAAISYKSDATAPVVSAQLQAYKDAEGNTPVGDQVSPSASVNVGGSEKGYVKFTITGSDANGIDGFRLTLNYIKADDETEKQIKLTSKDDWATDGFYTMGSTNDDGTVWTTDTIDLSAMQTGPITGSIDVYDKSGLIGNASIIFNVDNTAPTVTFTSPSSTEELTGDITFGGTSTDTGNAGTSTTAWLIPTAAQREMDDDTLAAVVDGEGKSIWKDTLDANKSVSVWAFTLDSATLAAYDNTTYATSTVNAIYTLPFYIKTTDAFGNTKIDRTFTFKHNPNADRPVTAVTYPNSSNYGTDSEGNAVNYVTLGSAIRISGSALIPSNTTTVDSVYLQIVNGSANLSDDDEIGDKYTLTSSYAASHGCTVMTKAQVQTALGKTLTFADDFAWGIKAEKTSAWSLTINENDEMSPDSGQLTYIAIRACAVNAEGKVGSWTSWYYINIDDTAPTQSPMLYQFKTTAPSTNCTAATIIDASNISASSTYTSDMYLKGDWYLTIKLNDESSIDTTKTVVKHGSTTLTAGTGYYVSSLVTGSDGKEKIQYLFIPVSTAEETASYTVVVADSEHRITDTYNLNIDNHAPEITAVYKGSTDNSANYLSEDSANTVTDSNYVYTMGGKVSETGSGFARLVFYYVRANAIDGETYTTEAVLDPLITTGTADAKAAISGLTRHSYTQDTSTYYMYGKEIAGTLGADGFTFTATTASDISGNAHIREGGLIEVAGLLRRIDTISSGTVTFATSTGVTSATSATAFFPYAQVVDNTTTEKVSSQSANPFSFTDDADDGDLMPETLTGSKALGFTWDATIHSFNIPDGPCALVVLAFDTAGNVSGNVYPVKVENSAPRLAKVFLGTDLNSSDTWSANEFTGYNVYDANDTYGITTTSVKAEQTISTASYGSAFQIKDKLAVVAEIVGGNGDIMMVYGRGASSTAAVPSRGTGAGITATANTTITSLVSSEAIGTVTYNNADAATSLKGYTLTNAQIVAAVTEANDGTGKKASFTFWDSTDELVQGTTSQNCVLLVNDFTIDLVDSIPPKVVINPFYWSSASKNSIYSNDSTNGHIELEGDLTGTAALTLYGSDPKVSGKITFTGTAYDEHSLKNLKFTLANASGTALTGFSSIAMGSYDSTSTDETYVANGGWSALSGNSGAAVSSTGKYEWTISTAATDASRYYEDTAYLSQEGHKVYWTISIDTAQIPNVAEQNIKLTVTAYDGNKYSTESTVSAADVSDGGYTVTDGTTHVPSYQMDVVPYITGIKTSVRKASGLKDNNIRSASGKYSILANNAENVITVTGFNFNTEALVAKLADASTSAATAISSTTGGTALTITASDTSTAVITNSDITKSGYLEIFSKTVRALNNINSNDAHGSFTRTSSVDDYKNMPNRVDEADFYTIKNVMLTDDRYIRFFDMKDTGVKNGYYPVMVMSKEDGRGDNPVFGYVDLKGAPESTTGDAGNFYNSYAMPQRAEFKPSTTDNSATAQYTEYLVKGSIWDQMAMAVDEGGRYYQASVYNRDGCNMAFVYDKFCEMHELSRAIGNAGYSRAGGGWGAGVVIGDNSYYQMSYTTGNNAINLESVNYNDDLTIGRYQYPKLKVLGDSTDGAAQVYMMYYDDGAYDPDDTDKTGGIIFRDFQIGTTVTGTSRALYSGGSDNENGTYSQKYNFTENTGNGDDTYSSNYRHIAADNASNHFDFDVTSSGVVVFVYYDSSEDSLVLKYSDVINGSEPGTAPTWHKADIDFPDNISSYVSMTLDGNAVHIAAFDSYDSNLVYMYLPSYTSTDLTSVTVDQASAVGNWTQIKVKDGVPYIAYYNATETGGRDPIKLAYPVLTKDSNGNTITASTNKTTPGVDVQPGTPYAASGSGQATGYTTGTWEYMTVPAITPPQGGDPKFQNVCLDFDSDGVPVIGYLGTNLEFGKWYTEE